MENAMFSSSVQSLQRLFDIYINTKGDVYSIFSEWSRIMLWQNFKFFIGSAVLKKKTSIPGQQLKRELLNRIANQTHKIYGITQFC